MIMSKVIFLLLVIFILPLITAAQETMEQKTKRMQWFEEARLGIFIHWGIYAVNGIEES